jgi:hypothetical protein
MLAENVITDLIFLPLVVVELEVPVQTRLHRVRQLDLVGPDIQIVFQDLQ